MTVRQFHAKYPLQVKRKAASRKPRRSPPKKTAPRTAAVSDGKRQAVRAVLLGFAKDLAAAEGQADTIELVRNLDKYVDQIVKAAG